MPNPNQIGGTAYVFVNGKIVPMAADMTFDPLEWEKETVRGAGGAGGPIRRPRYPSLEISGYNTRDLDLRELDALQGNPDDTITLDLDNTEVWACSGAILVGTPPTIDLDGNVSTMRFEFLHGVEQTS